MMKKLSLYIFLVLMFCNLTNISKAKEIEAFCLVERSDLINAKLHKDDHSRFLGKEINFLISFEDKLIVDFSEDDAMSVITGMYGPGDMKEFEETASGINYKNEIDIKGDKEGEMLKYNYNNTIKTSVNGKPYSLHAKVDQSGFSFNSWNFKIDCRDYKYSEAEKKEAKKPLLGKKNGLPAWFKPLVKKGIKDQNKKKLTDPNIANKNK